MLRSALLLLAVAGILVIGERTSNAQTYGTSGENVVQWAYPYTVTDYYAQNYAAGRPWHGQHYYLQYGQPTALVVPPTASMQTNYSWGVSQNRMSNIYHQYGRPLPSGGGGMSYGTPRWPSNLGQFGVYPVRAPW